MAHVFEFAPNERVSLKNAAGSILEERCELYAVCELFCPILHAKQMVVKCLSILGIICLINAKEELKWRILSCERNFCLQFVYKIVLTNGLAPYSLGLCSKCTYILK